MTPEERAERIAKQVHEGCEGGLTTVARRYIEDLTRIAITEAVAAERAKRIALADAVEALAFKMKAPNPWTPQFVQLAIAARTTKNPA